MNDASGSPTHRGVFLLLVALVGWGVLSGWSLWQARRSVVVLNETMQRDWPADSAPKPGTRARLLTATEHLAQGDWSAVVSDLGAVRPPSRSQDITARRFLAANETLRARFTTAAAVAQSMEDRGVNAEGVRDALARAVRAASRRDEPTTAAYITIAEDLLRETELGGGSHSGAADNRAVAAMLDSIGPAFRLAEDLLTEGSAAPRKLLSRAAWSSQAGEFRQAVVLIRLAGKLLDSNTSSEKSSDGEMPEWFDALAAEPVATATQTQAEAAVELADRMIDSVMSEEPAQLDGPISTLVDKSRLALAAGRSGDAYWWASVALNALGMTDESIDLATADTP